LWNPATGQRVGAPIPADTTPHGGVLGVAFSPSGQLLASANIDGTARLWTVSAFKNPYGTLCDDAGAPTRQEWKQYADGEPQPGVCI
jgi:WD40 repeat protein